MNECEKPENLILWDPLVPSLGLPWVPSHGIPWAPKGPLPWNHNPSDLAGLGLYILVVRTIPALSRMTPARDPKHFFFVISEESSAPLVLRRTL